MQFFTGSTPRSEWKGAYDVIDMYDESDCEVSRLDYTLDWLKIECTHKILVVGESLFLFSMILCDGLQPKHAEQKQSPYRFFTSYTTNDDLLIEKREETNDNIKRIQNLSERNTVLRGVNAKALENTDELKEKCFDRVIWTFPYDPNADKRDAKVKFEKNRELLVDFFSSVKGFLAPGAIVYILLNGRQYEDWELENAVREIGFKPHKHYRLKFARRRGKRIASCDQFPGYTATKTNCKAWDRNQKNPIMHTFVIDEEFALTD